MLPTTLTLAVWPELRATVPRLVHATAMGDGESEICWGGTLPLLTTAVLVLLGIGAARWLYRNRPRIRGELVATPYGATRVIGRIRLSGTRARIVGLDGQPEGRGLVTARRVPGRDGGPARVVLTVTYSPDGSPGQEASTTCPLGTGVVVHGIRFAHLAPPRPPGRHRPTPGPDATPGAPLALSPAPPLAPPAPPLAPPAPAAAVPPARCRDEEQTTGSPRA